MWMKTTLSALGNVIQSIIWCQAKESGRLVFGGADNSQRLGHHNLIRTMGVQINRRQKCRLTWMGLKII